MQPTGPQAVRAAAVGEARPAVERERLVKATRVVQDRRATSMAGRVAVEAKEQVVVMPQAAPQETAATAAQTPTGTAPVSLMQVAVAGGRTRVQLAAGAAVAAVGAVVTGQQTRAVAAEPTTVVAAQVS